VTDANHGVRLAFDLAAERYDGLRRKFIPPFDDFYGVAVEVIPFDRSSRLRVLDLGAGTGLLTDWLLRAFPNAQVTLADVSDEMLARARERFAGRDEALSYVTLDYARESLGGPFDIVASALSIHHIEDADKVTLFKRIYESLSPGGYFVNAEQVSGATPASSRLFVEEWLRRVRAAEVSEEDMRAMFSRGEHDRLASVPAQLDWLRAAGFTGVDCFYQWYCFAVFGGAKG
jgi:tRNA (cmo5U34)-methyltransferase